MALAQGWGPAKLNLLNAGLEYNYSIQSHSLGLQVERALWDNQQDFSFANPHHAMNVRLAFQLINHPGLQAVNDKETGWAAGISGGYRFYVSKAYRGGYAGLFFGLRSDIWWSMIDWENSELPVAGSSSNLVVQPKLELGYKLQRSKYSFTFGVANGWRLNIYTDGGEVNQGWTPEGQFVAARRLYSVKNQTR